MPVMMTNRRNNTPKQMSRASNCNSVLPISGNHSDSIRVKVKDSRRKQQWVDRDPLPTPPRSPHSDLLDSEPIMDDLWDLWTGTGLIDDVADKDHKFTLDAALDELGFNSDDDQRHSSCSGTYRRLSLGDIDAEGLFNNFSGCEDSDLMTEGENEDELLKHLFKYVEDDSPPPTNPPSPPAATDNSDILSTFVINAPNEIKMEVGSRPSSPSTFIASHQIKMEASSSGPSSLDGDSSDDSGPSDETMSSDSGIDDEGLTDGMSPIYEEGFIGEDFLSDQPYLFADNTFESLLEASKLGNLFVEETPDLELKHDCMWNGICCPSKMPGGKKQGLMGTSCSPKFENFDDFMKAKIKIEPKEIELTIKPEPEPEMKVDVVQEDAMCWNNDPYQMWAGETPPTSQPNPAVQSDVGRSEEFKGMDWKDLIDDSKERYELEMLRYATMNDHSYANIHQDPSKMKARTENLPRKGGLQGFLITKGNGDDYSGVPRKTGTKILVPLKELIDTLQHKSYYVAPLGPGKKVVRFTGKETIQGLMTHALPTSFKPVSSYGVPQTTLFHRSANGQYRSSTLQTVVTTAANNTNTTTQSPTSTHSRHKKSKTNRSIMREGGTITFPDQVPSPSSPDPSLSESLLSSSSATSPNNLTASGRPKKTKTHNNMERMRRIDLRNSFDSLKKLVPPLAKSTKCSKVEILRRAEEYIRALKSLEKRLQREEATVRSRNEALKLKLLQSQPCA